MKKVFIIVAILLATATTITIVSCKKDKISEKTQSESSSKIGETILQELELSEMDENMITFGEKMKTAVSENNSVSMPIDEGLKTLTNYQNFTMCNAGFYSNGMVVDTIKSTINVTNGEVLLTDLYGLYEMTRTEILTKLNSLPGDQKYIYLIRSVVSDGLEVAELNNISSLVDINVITYMYENLSQRDVILDIFDSTDYWYDFDSLGKCDVYTGQCVGRDCITELNTKLHIRKNWPQCPAGYRTYFTYPENHINRSRNYPNTSSPNGHYSWPMRSDIDPADCVTPSEMTWYLLTIESDMDDIEDNWNMFIVDFLLVEVYHLPWREPNFIWETYLYYTVANMNCTPLPND